MITVKELLKQGFDALKDSSSTPVLDAELILIHTMEQSGLKFDKIKIITCGGNKVDDEISKSFMSKICQRKMGRPVQFITNQQEFMGLSFYVTEDVLIPRPDTEITVERVLESCKGRKNLQIMDMCTGSGAIAVSLAHYLGDTAIYAVDVSDAALECCKTNVQRYELENSISIMKSDLFEGISNELKGKLDVLVSNPPYIPTADIDELEINVKDYEPMLALDGGVDGLYFYREIAKTAKSYLKGEGLIFFEIGYNQGDEVKKILESEGYKDIKIEKDLAGWDRCVSAAFCSTVSSYELRVASDAPLEHYNKTTRNPQPATRN